MPTLHGGCQLKAISSSEVSACITLYIRLYPRMLTRPHFSVPLSYVHFLLPTLPSTPNPTLLLPGLLYHQMILRVIEFVLAVSQKEDIIVFINVKKACPILAGSPDLVCDCLGLE